MTFLPEVSKSVIASAINSSFVVLPPVKPSVLIRSVEISSLFFAWLITRVTSVMSVSVWDSPVNSENANSNSVFESSSTKVPLIFRSSIAPSWKGSS